MLFYSLAILVAASGLATSVVTRDISLRLRSFPGWAC